MAILELAKLTLSSNTHRCSQPLSVTPGSDTAQPHLLHTDLQPPCGPVQERGRLVTTLWSQLWTVTLIHGCRGSTGY